MAVPE